MTGWINYNLDQIGHGGLKKEIAPGKNHGVFLLGHILTSEDSISLFLGKGELLYPEYNLIFTSGSKLQPADKYPSTELLREQLNKVFQRNTNLYSEMSDSELNEPHSLLKGKMEDDFFKTKEGVITKFLAHQLHHTGQLSILHIIK